MATLLTEEIEQLKSDLAAAERARIRPEDQRVIDLQQQLTDKEHALFLRQESEARVEQDRQHALQLQSLLRLEHSISDAKTEVNMLRTLLTELPQRLSRAQWELSQLLRQHAILKSELKG